MTICIACLCSWYRPPFNTEKIAITASDRQMTAGDIEYEPNQLKISFQDHRTLILISGDYPTHSEALRTTSEILKAQPTLPPAEKAEIYAGCIRDVKFRHACNIYLAPLGLTREIFQKNDLANDSILGDLATKVMAYRGEYTEAIVVSADDHNAHIYYIDSDSKVWCQDDVGFAAIGVGAWHAKSQLMSTRYHNGMLIHTALGLIYAAKKRAPGVGTAATDLYMVTPKGHERILDQITSAIERLYNEFEQERLALAEKKLSELYDVLLQSNQQTAEIPAVQSAEATTSDHSSSVVHEPDEAERSRRALEEPHDGKPARTRDQSSLRLAPETQMTSITLKCELP